MANSRIQRRQEAERARVEAYEASLRRVSLRARPAPDFELALAEAMVAYRSSIVRDPSTWRPQMKTRDPARLRLAAARHLFARYPVAEHLEQIWLDARGLEANEVALRKTWYIVAAGGGSLFKQGAGDWLSRKEVHAFLNPLQPLGFNEALWQAVARSTTTDGGIALRIAGSRIARTPRTEFAFWREVVRFFCANPTTREEIDDHCDFLADCYRRNPAYSLKGRTLDSLGRQMREWHRDLAAIERIEAARQRAEAARVRALGLAWAPSPVGGGRWEGAPITDWSWQPSAKERSTREQFVVTQLRTAVDLVEETRAMQHCVASYASKCIAGHASIWSLRRIADGRRERLLTIELDSRYRAVQVRGFSNRMPHADERKILERWAKARGVELLS